MTSNNSGSGPFSPDEVAAVTGPPQGDPELDAVDPANIDEAGESDTPFEKLQSQGKRMSADRTRTLVESLLFVADKPLTVDQLFDATGVERPRIVAALESLQGTRREGISGIVLHEIAGGWQFRTDPGTAEYVRRFLKMKPQRLTRAAVETVAIVAYRQPVTRPEIEDIRGVDSGAVMKALLERRLVKILGKKEEVGRPILYGTTREFLEFFALKDLSSLPTLREFHELSEEHQEIVEKEAPPPVVGTVAALADATFRAKLDAENEASEAALAVLEAAIAGADATSKVTEHLLRPVPEAQPTPALPPESGQ